MSLREEKNHNVEDICEARKSRMDRLAYLTGAGPRPDQSLEVRGSSPADNWQVKRSTDQSSIYFIVLNT